MKVKHNNDGSYEVEGTAFECAEYERLIDNKPLFKITQPVPNTQPYISPYTYPYPSTTAPTNPFKWNEITCSGQLTCNTNDYIMIN